VGLPGASATLAVVNAASIVLFVLPFALLALWPAMRAHRPLPEMLGGLAGAICFVAAWIQRSPAAAPPPGSPPGAALAAVAVGGYALAARRFPLLG